MRRLQYATAQAMEWKKIGSQRDFDRCPGWKLFIQFRLGCQSVYKDSHDVGRKQKYHKSRR
jgi:hypothetical protein